MNDYERIAQVIRLLDKRHDAQPSLEQMAAVVGLSESHFHHLFRRWAGVTPKDFLQCLTAEFAKQRLRESTSVLEAALAAGLSGPSRLHDLMVTLEAASPGEWKSQGAGVRIHWGISESPFGRCSIAWNTRGVCHLGFLDAGRRNGEHAELTADWAAAERVRDDRNAQRQCDGIFSRAPGARTRLSALVRGTQFQVKVWRALLQVPPGCLTSYSQIARTIGEPRAVRAVGRACGQNPVAYLIPCHRVIRETGIVQGYRWGTARKRAILAWEAAGVGTDSNMRWDERPRRTCA
jgi:AraC family transcriptional regulator of adaptative response/methylated-DNA-[protein]-cysteine methyltransferase